MQQRDRLDKATAALLASLIVRGCSLVWRYHHSGGAVLEDIGGEVVTADWAAVNGASPRDRDKCALCQGPCAQVAPAGGEISTNARGS